MLNQAIPALRWAAAGLVAAAWLAPVALAQGNGTAGTAKKELVQKVLQLQGPGIESVGTQLAAQTAQQVLGAAGQALQRVPGDKRELLGTEIQADVKKFFDDVAPSLRTSALKLGPTILGTALEERLNEDELKTVVAWLESPVSRKFGQLNAEVQQALMQRLVTDSRAAVDPKLKALEQTLTKRLGAAAPAAAAPSGGAAAAPKK